jgi:hypothetical protein
VKNPRRAMAGLALGAAGMLYSRLSGRREQPSPEVEAPRKPEEHPHEGGASQDELDRARSELNDALARLATRADR